MPLEQQLQLTSHSQPRCSICRDMDRREIIDARLTTPGAGLKAIAMEFGLSVSALQRHRPHMAMIVEQARALREVEQLGVLYKRLKTQAERLRELAVRAEGAGNFQAAVAAMGEARKHEEMLLRLGEKPGFRDTAAATTVNAPDARIVITRD